MSRPTTAAPLSMALLDCDGTIVDSQHRIHAGLQAAWDGLGLGLLEVGAVRRVIGLSLEEAIARLAPDLAPHDCARAGDLYRRAFYDCAVTTAHGEPLFDGFHDGLDALEAEGHLLGIATGKGSSGLRKTLEPHGVLHRFVTLQTADLVAAGKPAPDMALQAAAEAGVECHNTVVIGDTVFDIMMAKSAGMQAIGVAWGYHEPDDLMDAGASGIAAHWRDVPDLVARALAPGE